MTYRMIIIPDIHMRNKYRDEVRSELRKVSSEIRGLEPDLVIGLGDILEQENNKKADEENIKAVKSILSDSKFETLFLAGNHDVEDFSRKELRKIFGNKLWGDLKTGETDIIYLDSSAPSIKGPQGLISEEQIDFLDEKLENANRAIILSHHPLHYQNTRNTYWWHKCPERALCTNKKRVNDLLEKHENIELVVSGHLHEKTQLIKYRNIPRLSLNAFSKETYEKPVTGTYAIIEIDKNIKIEVKKHKKTMETYEV